MANTKLSAKRGLKMDTHKKHDGDERIPAKVKEMEAELGAGNHKPEVLPKLAQYELTLLDWIEAASCRLVLWSV